MKLLENNLTPKFDFSQPIKDGQVFCGVDMALNEEDRYTHICIAKKDDEGNICILYSGRMNFDSTLIEDIREQNKRFLREIMEYYKGVKISTVQDPDRTPEQKHNPIKFDAQYKWCLAHGLVR